MGNRKIRNWNAYNKLKTELCIRNQAILKSPYSDIVAVGISEEKANELRVKMAATDFSVLDWDESLDHGQTIITDGKMPYMVSVDCLDEDSLRARLASELYIINVMPLKRIWIK
jgi:hypothetical protein